MKISIEEKDESQKYRPVPVRQFKEMTVVRPDRIIIFVPNLCGGETRITLYKTENPDGNLENYPALTEIKKRNGL